METGISSGKIYVEYGMVMMMRQVLPYHQSMALQVNIDFSNIVQEEEQLIMTMAMEMIMIMIFLTREPYSPRWFLVGP